MDYTDDYNGYKWHERSSFSPVHDLTHNVRRRVRTNNYEYLEDRGSEINNHPVHTAKLSKGLVESFFSKLFYFVFMAALSPIKTFEFMTARIAWILNGFSYPVYNLRSRIVYKNVPYDETLPYTNRFANFLSELPVSCFLTISALIKHVLFLPFIIFFYIINLYSNQSKQSLQQQAVGMSERYGKKERRSTTGFILFPAFLQSSLFSIAKSVRERAAYSLAYIFGPKAAMLVDYKEVRPVKRTGFVTDFKSSDAIERPKRIHAGSHNRSHLFPIRSSVICSSAFWKWLFLLAILLLLLVMFYKRHDGLTVDGTELFDKIQWNFFDVAEWRQKIGHGLNSVLRNVLYLLSAVFHFLYDRLLYPAKLYGAVVHPRKTVEEVIQLGKYAYITVDYIYENIIDVFSFLRNLISSVVQILLALPSYFISIATQLIPFVNEKTKGKIGSNNFNQQQAEWTLEHLRHEKESLELEVLQLRRERELEEDRYKNIHKALRIVEKSAPPMSTNERLRESSLVENELFQYKSDENFLNYMAKLRKSDDEELRKRLLDIEKRLIERLETLSGKIENEIAQKIIRNSEQPYVGWPALSNELSELSSAVGNLRAQFDQLREEKEAKIAQFTHSIMIRDAKGSDDFDKLKAELNKKVKDDLDKELSSSLNRFEKASHEEREAFRLEIMKAVENRVLALFAGHITEKNGAISETKLSSALKLSESDFIMINKMITDALDTYDADKTGKVDYALESSGASVISTRCTEPYKENSRLESVFGIPLWYSSYSPRAVIQHRPLAAGECWAFRGKGYLTIKLSHPIYITEISYEHLHSTLHPDGVLKSAPKLFQVYSYETVDNLKSKSLIGQYEYDIRSRALQTFHSQNDLKTPVSIVELVVQSNWGSDYTCLYRFRVHGQKA